MPIRDEGFLVGVSWEEPVVLGEGPAGLDEIEFGGSGVASKDTGSGAEGTSRRDEVVGKDVESCVTGRFVSRDDHVPSVFQRESVGDGLLCTDSAYLTSSAECSSRDSRN